MLPPTFAPCVLTFAPYNLTFGPCACGVSLLSTGANIPLAQVVVVTSCNLRSWCFFIQPLAQIVHLHTWWYHPLQLALVVLFHSPTGANTALAPGQLALCGGGQWWWYIYIYSRIIITIYSKEVLACTNTIRFSQLLFYYVYIVKQLICLLISDCAAKCEYTRSYTFLHMHTCRM